jgi:hypothetical protein
MREQNMTGLEFKGQELPRASIQDILTESWRLEEGGHAGGVEDVKDQGQSRTRTIHLSTLSSSF